MPHPAQGPLLRLAAKLRFPYLFFLTAALFLIDLVVPDILPFADELLLGMLTLLFGAWRRRDRSGPVRGRATAAAEPKSKRFTPRS